MLANTLFSAISRGILSGGGTWLPPAGVRRAALLPASGFARAAATRCAAFSNPEMSLKSVFDSSAA
jgi:hypothetical protein